MPWYGRRARGSRSHPRARAQRLDVLAGILGFFTMMALVQVVTLEVRGEDAVLAALVLLGCVLLLGWALLARHRTGA